VRAPTFRCDYWGVPQPVGPHAFNGHALFDALDTRRISEGLSWAALARLVWDQSADLNAQLQALGRPAADFVYPATW
jgi:hypothetical protein